ncbi:MULTISPECIES: GNAT family N-acetyltransferase [Clostridium]|uniref:GNAT family N-acetyltransferase n=1 Tax=Clostridium TaxID=1485 RepID=UPI0008250861|nr:MULTISPECIES: GNAT family protein [Clostridium]PJI08236.1 N-acetyltransferase [Clostridium sp. CT7]
MLKGNYVKIEEAKGVEREYVITDKFGITIGRIFILDISKVDKFCLFRIKFYKQGEDIYAYVKDSLHTFVNSLFKVNVVNKVSVIIDEEIDTQPFVDLGFILEGIINKSIIEKSIYKDEFIFGIDYKRYNSGRINVVKLYGKNINLKVLTPEDANDMTCYYIKNKEHLKKFEPEREESFYTFEVQKQILMENYKQFLNGEGINFGIYKANDLIGKIQISGIMYGVFKSAIIGYSMDKDYQGRGYMKESVSLVEDYAFNVMKLHRIEASTLVDNLRSQNVLIGCEFEKLGVNKNYLFINGKWQDHITFYKVNKK